LKLKKFEVRKSVPVQFKIESNEKTKNLVPIAEHQDPESNGEESGKGADRWGTEA
jgi:hypothetical protein